TVTRTRPFSRRPTTSIVPPSGMASRALKNSVMKTCDSSETVPSTGGSCARRVNFDGRGIVRLPQLHDLRGTPDHVVEWYRAGLEPTESRHVLQVANRRGGRLDALAQTFDDGSLCLRDHSVACQDRDAGGDAAQR